MIFCLLLLIMQVLLLLVMQVKLTLEVISLPYSLGDFAPYSLSCLKWRRGKAQRQQQSLSTFLCAGPWRCGKLCQPHMTIAVFSFFRLCRRPDCLSRAYGCLAVTCHLQFWQNNRGLVILWWHWGGRNRYGNKSRHRKLPQEKTVLPQLLLGIKLPIPNKPYGFCGLKHHVYLRTLDQTDDLLIASWALYHLAMFLYPRVSALTPFHGSADHRH